MFVEFHPVLKKGYSQIFEVAYWDTSIHYTTRLVSLHHKWVFLMTSNQPSSMVEQQEDSLLVRKKEALHGLKQVLRVWYNKINYH